MIRRLMMYEMVSLEVSNTKMSYQYWIVFRLQHSIAACQYNDILLLNVCRKLYDGHI
jgi:hypothetical protein